MNATPQTPGNPNPETTILQPVDQVFTENKDLFTTAGITRDSLTQQAPQDAQMATQTDLQSLSEKQKAAVEKAMNEGYFISVDGKTFQPTQEGVSRRVRREALTQAAKQGGYDVLIEAGLWDKETNCPQNLDRLHKMTNDNADISSSDEDDKKAEALLKGYRVEGNWWEKNKSWLIPLITALAGSALGFALAKCFDTNDKDGANAATQLISQATNQSTNTNDNNNANSNAESANTQTPNASNTASSTTNTQTPNVSNTISGVANQTLTQEPSSQQAPSSYHDTMRS